MDSHGNGQLPRYSSGFVDAKAHNVLADAIEGRGIPTIGNGDERQPNDESFWFRVLDNKQDGENYRWSYGGEEVYKKTAGPNGWAALTGGQIASAEGSDGPSAWNTLEDINTDSGMTGIGVNIDNLPENESGDPAFELQPIPSGVVVRAWVVICDDQTYEIQFTAANGIDGTCPNEAPTDDPPPDEEV